MNAWLALPEKSVGRLWLKLKATVHLNTQNTPPPPNNTTPQCSAVSTLVLQCSATLTYTSVLQVHPKCEALLYCLCLFEWILIVQKDFLFLTSTEWATVSLLVTSVFGALYSTCQIAHLTKSFSSLQRCSLVYVHTLTTPTDMNTVLLTVQFSLSFSNSIWCDRIWGNGLILRNGNNLIWVVGIWSKHTEWSTEWNLNQLVRDMKAWRWWLCISRYWSRTLSLYFWTICFLYNCPILSDPITHVSRFSHMITISRVMW